MDQLMSNAPLDFHIDSHLSLGLDLKTLKVASNFLSTQTAGSGPVVGLSCSNRTQSRAVTSTAIRERSAADRARYC